MVRTWTRKYLEGDAVIWFVVLALSAWGVLVVYSASSSLAYRVPRRQYRILSDETYFLAAGQLAGHVGDTQSGLPLFLAHLYFCAPAIGTFADLHLEIRRDHQPSFSAGLLCPCWIKLFSPLT